YSEPFVMNGDTEDYRIMAEWPHGDNDIDFQGKTGNIKLEIIATQIYKENAVTANVETVTKGQADIEGQPEIASMEFNKLSKAIGFFKFNDGDGHAGSLIVPARLDGFDSLEQMAATLADYIDKNESSFSVVK